MIVGIAARKPPFGAEPDITMDGACYGKFRAEERIQQYFLHCIPWIGICQPIIKNVDNFLTKKTCGTPYRDAASPYSNHRCTNPRWPDQQGDGDGVEFFRYLP
jgi:hypothetical protein